MVWFVPSLYGNDFVAFLHSLLRLKYSCKGLKGCFLRMVFRPSERRGFTKIFIEEKESERAMDIKIQIFTQEFGDDVTQLFRKNYIGIAATLLQSSKSPFVYITSTILTVLLWCLVINNLLVAFLLSASFSYILALFIIFGPLFYDSRYDGQVYPNTLLKMDGGMYFLATDTSHNPSRLVGCIGIQPLTPSKAYIILFCVDKKYRGKGIGRRLLKTAIDYCRNQRYATGIVDIWDVSSVRYSVLPMFEKTGFVKTKVEYVPHTYIPVIRILFLEKDFRY